MSSFKLKHQNTVIEFSNSEKFVSYISNVLGIKNYYISNGKTRKGIEFRSL